MAKAIEEYTEFQKYVKAKFNIPSTDKADYLFLFNAPEQYEVCLLYTSDAADD